MIPMIRPRFPKVDEFAARFDAVLASGNVTNNGEYVREFEAALTEYIGTPTIVFCNGQSALMAMLAAAKVEGGEVITPSLTFCATPHAITWAGARPVFAECRFDNYTVDVSDVERKINSNTRAILSVDPYGICSDYDSLVELGETYHIPVLFDSAAAFGSLYKNKLTGGFGDAQMFSFHATKGFSCMEGGAISSNDSDIIEIAKRVRNFGQDIDGDCEYAGINGKMQEINAIVGLDQLKSWDADSLARKNIVLYLSQELEKNVPLAVQPNIGDQDPCWLYYPIRITDDLTMPRDGVMAALAEAGIQTRKYYLPCHELTVYRSFSDLLPVTEQIGREVIALPVHTGMLRSEVDMIVNALAEISTR